MRSVFLAVAGRNVAGGRNDEGGRTRRSLRSGTISALFLLTAWALAAMGSDTEAETGSLGPSAVTETKIVASDAAAGDEFGRKAVSVSGETSIVGAWLDDDRGSDSGSAYIFQVLQPNQSSAANWGQVMKLNASDAAAGDYFGRAVSIDGDTAIVGAYGDDDAGSDSGSAYVFYRNQGGADNWGQVAKLTASDAAAGDCFGRAVSIDGDTAIVGAWWDDDAGSGSGSAYVFERDEGGADSWGRVAKLTASDAAAGDYFGRVVSIGGDTAIVGAYGDNDAGSNSGSAYFFERNEGGAGNWGEVQKMTASDAAVGDEFGHGVSISGDTAIVGAYLDDDGGTNSGSAYVLQRNPSGAGRVWEPAAKLVASDAAAGDYFGWAVSIDRDMAVVGAYGDNTAATDSGSAYLFLRNQGGADNWGQVAKLSASDAEAGDLFGGAVSISGDTAIVGAFRDDDGGANSGSAYLFDQTPGPPVRFAKVTHLPLTGQIEDILLDETRDRFWVLRKQDGRVEALRLDDGEEIATIRTGLEPESFAMTYDRRYLGVGSRGNIYLTVIDLESDLSDKVGFYNSGDLQKVFRVAPIGASDFIFVTRPDQYGSPPTGGRVNVWRGDSRTVTLLPESVGANNFIAGLPPGDLFLISAWGYSQGGIALRRFSRQDGTWTQLGEHFTGTFHGSNTVFGVDAANKQFIIDDDLVSITDTSLIYRGPLPYRYPGACPLFNPANPNEAILSPLSATRLEVWDLSILQPDFELELPGSQSWRGRGQFSADGEEILVLVDSIQGPGVVHFASGYPDATATPATPPTPTPTAVATPAPTAEPVRALIASFYQTILEREPEAGAVDLWHHGYFDYAASFNIDVRFIPREMARLFFLSDEYANRGRTDSEFITDCYRVFLNRAPNQTELDNWTSGVWNRSQVMTVFSESEEFANRMQTMFPGLGGNATRNFVTFMYVGLLDRLVDRGGLEYAAGLFDAAYAQGGLASVRAQAAQMAREVIQSEEFLSKNPTTAVYVTRFYRAFLGRFPNDAEVAYWSAELDSGRRTTDGVIGLFADSAEFTERLRMHFGTP